MVTPIVAAMRPQTQAGLGLGPLSPKKGGSQKDAKLAQKLGQLQPFFYPYSHRNARANWHLLGQPNTFVARDILETMAAMMHSPLQAGQHLWQLAMDTSP